MPDDHTAGFGTGAPDPVAEVADNDLAVGRIIDTISHSAFWKSSAVFVVEDDTQNGTPSPSMAAPASVPARRPSSRSRSPEQAVYGQWVVWSRNSRFNGIGMSPAPGLRLPSAAAGPLTYLYSGSATPPPSATAPDRPSPGRNTAGRFGHTGVKLT